MNLSEALQNQNVKAFLWTIRVGEGTANDNGYHTLVGGSHFPSLDSHPHTSVSITFRNGRTIRSTAAGAYQFLSGTWDNLVKQYGFTDFSENSQDLGAIALIQGRNALDDIIAGNIQSAINKCNKEWASLPGSPYGQPTRTMDQALETYRLAGGLLRPEGTFAPVETRTPIMFPFLAAVLPSLISAAPDLIRAFGGDGKITERNANAAQVVVDAAKAATNSVNEQDLVEKIQSGDPAVIAQVQQAVKDVWYEINVDTGGIQAARDSSIKAEGFWKQPAIWVTAALLPMAYIVVLTVMGLIGHSTFSGEIQSMVIASVISGVLGAITGFWLGTSFSSSRKTEIMNK